MRGQKLEGVETKDRVSGRTSEVSQSEDGSGGGAGGG